MHGLHVLGHWLAVVAFVLLAVLVGAGWLFWRLVMWLFNRR